MNLYYNCINVLRYLFPYLVLNFKLKGLLCIKNLKNEKNFPGSGTQGTIFRNVFTYIVIFKAILVYVNDDDNNL